MNDNIKTERQINTLEDLRLKKLQLKKKSEKKSKKIKKKLTKLTKQSNIQNIYNEILSEFNLQHSILNMMPMALKYKNQLSNIKLSKENKKKAIIAIGAITSAALTYFFLSNKQNSQNKQNDKPEFKDNFNDYFDGNLFI